jgi:2-amino-4-hydroxy-6-hydroxymethyldihydropteridine diphosphokinase
MSSAYPENALPSGKRTDYNRRMPNDFSHQTMLHQKPSKARRVWIALGGNQGDVLPRLEQAVSELCQRLPARCLKHSGLYQTPPEGNPELDPFLNAVILLEARATAAHCLETCLAIEQEFGRIRNPYQTLPEARPLDLDVLAIDSLCLTTDTLTLPHPRLQQRRFVLQPMHDIDPDWRHPLSGEPVSEMLKRLGAPPPEFNQIHSPAWYSESLP